MNEIGIFFMNFLLRLLRQLFAQVRQPVIHAARKATRLHRATVYGFDWVLWSHLSARRRDPIPVELPRALMEKKNVRFAPPVLMISGPADFAATWEEGFAAVNAALFLNLQVPDLLSRFRYAHPAPAFKGVYLWDSAFIAQIWKVWDIQTASEILYTVIDLRDEDRLQHVVADLVTSPYTQPPLIAWSLAGLLRAMSAEDYEKLNLPEAFRILARFNEWLYRERRHPNGLFFWRHAYESGVENSPRFGSRDERILIDTRQFASPDFCAYMVLQNEALAEIADYLGDGNATQRFHAQAEVLRELINERLWDNSDGFYYDRHITTGEFIRSRTIAGLLPLWGGIPDHACARRLLEQVMNPHCFNTPMPLPSTARDDPSFEFDMWRGPVWINTAYGVILGLERYGFLREAAELTWRLCEGVYATHAHARRIYEFYDPEERHIGRLNRKLGNRWKKLTLGNKPVAEFVGWSGLVNVLTIEHLLGFHRDKTGLFALCPRMPAQAAGIGFSLRLSASEASIHIDVLDAAGTVRGVMRRLGKVRFFEARFGEKMFFP
jgi:hypothetical protein